MTLSCRFGFQPLDLSPLALVHVLIESPIIGFLYRLFIA
jgi:hypothetical protein